MKDRLHTLIANALTQLEAEGLLPAEQRPSIVVNRTPRRLYAIRRLSEQRPSITDNSTGDSQLGDYACPIAMAIARYVKRNPYDNGSYDYENLVAQYAHLIVKKIKEQNEDGINGIDRIEIAAAGFINFFIDHSYLYDLISAILRTGTSYGRSNSGQGRKLQVEFVSTNPTGPLHVGHGRGAAIGSVIANLLQTVGFEVQREYYLNDVGRQTDILAVSVWLRYLELCGQSLRFPSNGYKGSYILDIASEFYRLQGQACSVDTVPLFGQLPPDAPAGDKEAHIDAVIGLARQQLKDRYQTLHALALQTIVDDIRDDLQQFGVTFDNWLSERSLLDNGGINRVIDTLQQSQHVYHRDGALWFRSSAFGDEKDRVIERENGERTYFASDIAYVANKMERGFDPAIYVLGADHHGYVARIKAACAALGYDPCRIKVCLVQFAVQIRAGQKVQMSTRSGEYVTLRELREEVGTDAARFFYVMRRGDQHLDFDLELATSHTNNNPVYYVQYAHARIASVLRRAAEQGMAFDLDRVAKISMKKHLTAPHEFAVMRTLSRYSEVIELAAHHQEPHRLTVYLCELANDLHAWYNAEQFLIEEADRRTARLALAEATRQVIFNGLQVLGVSAPDSM